MDVATQREWEIQWHEGMLLSPQHFQQQQRYRDSERLHELSLHQPHYWGVYELSLEKGPPSENIVSIKRLYGVMPDGLIVNYFADSKEDPPLQLDLEEQEEIEEGKDAVPVYLAVPKRGKAAASDREAAIKRFDSIAGEPVVDENTGEGDVPISRLRPKLELLATANPRSTHVTMPLFEVQKDLVGTYKITPYTPPLLRMAQGKFLGNPSLTDDLYSLIKRIRDKASRLDNLGRSSANNLTDEQRQEKRTTAVHLSGGLPLLEVLLGAGAHPFQVYQALALLAGQFARFAANDSIPPPLPRYDHNNIRKCIFTAAGYIDRIVDSIRVAFSIVPFEKDDLGQFFLALSAERISPRMVVVFQTSEANREDDLRHFARTARIATETAFAKELTARRLGATREVLPDQQYLAQRTSVSQVVVQISPETDDQLIRTGEKLFIARSDKTPVEHLPDTVSLYVSHDAGAEPNSGNNKLS